jgi:YegS/Rv2252/BmrU family lipid kinase
MPSKHHQSAQNFMSFSSRILIICNPTSGGSGSGLLERVVAALSSAGASVEVRNTTRRGEAEDMAREACAAGVYDVIVAAGGDGTIGEVANGLAPDAPPLAIVPLGTANVLAAEIGLAHRAAVVAETILRGCARQVYAGRANGRRFLMMAGAGLDAEVVAGVDPKLKRCLGKIAYVTETWRQMLRYGYPVLDAVIDGTGYRAVTVVASKGRKYGGPHMIAPAADLTRPDFVVTLFEKGGPWRVALYGLALLVGLLPRLPGVRHIRGTHVAVTGPAGAPVQGDGDLVAHLPLGLEIDPVPLTVLYPPDPA